MLPHYLFSFKSNLEDIPIALKLNNPFKNSPSEIAKIAAKEFQAYIASEQHNWEHNFNLNKGKMFGVLVVQNNDDKLFYLGTISGKLMGKIQCDRFIPSVFDDATDDFFINKGMKELSNMSTQIISSESQTEKDHLIAQRKKKSFQIQQQLFENYSFQNLSGDSANVLEIFKSADLDSPPSAAGECAAPKLLQFALSHNLKPIAIAEFWWGKSPKSEQREHLVFYPACKNKCRPILEFMLEDTTLFDSSIID